MSEIVYNGLEIKNDITKERRGFAIMLFIKIVCSGSGGTAIANDGETTTDFICISGQVNTTDKIVRMELFISHSPLYLSVREIAIVGCPRHLLMYLMVISGV